MFFERSKVIRVIISHLNRGCSLAADMASAPASGDASWMEDYLTCSICMDTFQNPVTTTCGHSFCKECLNLSYELSQVCPMCMTPLKRVPHVNIVLRNIVQQRREDKMKEEEDHKMLEREWDDWARYHAEVGPSGDKQETKVHLDNSGYLL